MVKMVSRTIAPPNSEPVKKHIVFEKFYFIVIFVTPHWIIDLIVLFSYFFQCLNIETISIFTVTFFFFFFPPFVCYYYYYCVNIYFSINILFHLYIGWLLKPSHTTHTLEIEFYWTLNYSRGNISFYFYYLLCVCSRTKRKKRAWFLVIL